MLIQDCSPTLLFQRANQRRVDAERPLKGTGGRLFHSRRIQSLNLHVAEHVNLAFHFRSRMTPGVDFLKLFYADLGVDRRGV